MKQWTLVYLWIHAHLMTSRWRYQVLREFFFCDNSLFLKKWNHPSNSNFASSMSPRGHSNIKWIGCKAHTFKGWDIRWEHNLKKWGSLGEKQNFGSKLGGNGWEWYLWSFSESFKSRICTHKIVEYGKNDQFVDEFETKSSFLWQPNAKIGGLWVKAIQEPTFHQKMWGLWVRAETKKTALYLTKRPISGKLRQ